MVGIIDVGGGMRGIYTAGVYDCLHDRGIKPDYGLGPPLRGGFVCGKTLVRRKSAAGQKAGRVALLEFF